MVEHDFARFDGESPSHAQQRISAGTYAMTQAFFYAADLWVDKPPLVSAEALAYANERWGTQAHKVWTLKRAEIRRVDGCKISESGLIYEHVTTGAMFRQYIHTAMAGRMGVLDPFDVAEWLQENYQTAWVTRKEDQTLTSRRYKSQRGERLENALSAYAECGIVICSRPATSPPVVRVGDFDLDNEPDTDIGVSDDESTAPAIQDRVNAGGNYIRFFTALSDALKARRSRVSVLYRGDRPYASVIGLDPPGVSNIVLLLEAPRGAKIRTPVLSLEAATDCPGEEPGTPGWAALRDTFAGSEWRISFGRDKKVPNALCRCKRSLADAFEVTDASAVDEAAQRTANEIEATWAALHG